MKLRARYQTISQLQEFATELKRLSNQVGFKLSSRGWAYIMEQNRMINKDEFDKVTNLINKCRKEGLIPIDFVAEESSRQFEGVETPYNGTIYDRFRSYLRWSLDVHSDFDVNWWANEEYYIQMVVEKVDLVTLFYPVCADYKIPIANSKGWSSMLQRAEYARRFKEAEDNGLKCVLLYCGDHDPDGLRISEFLRKNLEDLNQITWKDGTEGYNPENLIIDRFGLNYDFIEKNNFTWIDNLITGSGRNLASSKHKNYNQDYVQEYLRNIGERKCEANAIVTLPKVARKLCLEAIEKYLGEDALERFESKQDEVKEEFNTFKAKTEMTSKVHKLIDESRAYEDKQ